MTQDSTWTDVDAYFAGTLIGADEALDAAVSESESAGLPNIQVSPALGQLLHLLVKMHGATRILEIGTLGAYSTIWMARALPAGGRIVSLEISRQHAEIARKNIARAGLGDVVDVRIGAALETLSGLQSSTDGSFDFAFIDADKQNIPHYFDWARRLGRPGMIIVVDNVVRDGAVIDAHSDDGAVQGLRRLFEMIEEDDRVQATAIQTVGCKGYDGFLLARVDG